VEGIVYGSTTADTPYSSALGLCAGVAFADAVGSTAIGTCALCASTGGFNSGIVTGLSIQDAGPAINPGSGAGITGLTVISSPFAFGGPFTNVPLETVTGSGFSATVSFQFSFGSFQLLRIDLAGGNYRVGDTVRIPASVFGGFSDVNLTVSSTVPTVYSNRTALSTSGSGTGFVVDLFRDRTSGLICAFSIPNAGGGKNFAVSDTITISGATLGGTTPTNDTVLSVSSTTNASVGGCNTALGYLSGCAITAGAGNTLVGRYAGFSNMCNATALSDGTGAIRFYANCFGAWSLGNSTTNTGSSGQALVSEGANNSPTWVDLPSTATPTAQGLVIGCTKFAFTSLGDNSSGTQLTTGTNNTAIGASALFWLQAGNRNTALGDQAIFSQTAENENDNTAIGYASMDRGGGSQNTAVGSCSLSCSGTDGSGGDANIGVGYSAGCNINQGSNNTIVGWCSGLTLVSGCNNTVLGSGANVAAFNSSNSITLGDSSITVIRAQVTSITSLSDARDKTAVTALPVGLDFVNSLNPVKFTWQMRVPNETKDGTSEAGFIAQELKAAQELSGAEYLGLVYEDNPEKLEASPGKLVPVLVKAIQELSAKVDSLQTELNALKANG
jgi:hypothetical protein